MRKRTRKYSAKGAQEVSRIWTDKQTEVLKQVQRE